MATKCPISRQRFFEKAKSLVLSIGDDVRVVMPTKEFESKSFGWWFNQRMYIEVDGVTLPIQPSLGLVVVGSKSIP